MYIGKGGEEGGEEGDFTSLGQPKDQQLVPSVAT